MTSLKPQFSISASWSSAGVGTCIVVDLNEMGNQKIAFDMGSTPIFDHAVKASYVFISHGHLDHIGEYKNRMFHLGQMKEFLNQSTTQLCVTL